MVITQARKGGISEADSNHFSKKGYNRSQSRITRRDRS